MSFVIFDLEFNNMQGVNDNLRSFLSEDKDRLRHLYPNEIIQIGAVKVDEDLKEVDRLNIFVKNALYKNLNPFISEMTGITPSDLENGIVFKEAIMTFKDFCSNSNIITWGVSDILEIIRNCHMHSLPITVIGDYYLDLQNFIGLKDFQNKSPGLKNALNFYDISCLDEKLHDGLYDSLCTVEVLKKAMEKYRAEIPWKSSRVIFSSDAIYINDIKVRDIPDSQITLKCPLCMGHIIYDISMNNDHGKIKSMYHCEDCSASFIEDIQVKENMVGERKYFKKIKKIPKDFFKMIVKQRRESNKNRYY